MRYPKFLKENGTIALVAPSFGAATEPYKSLLESAIRYFESRGFKIDKGPNIFLGEGIGISNTPEKCASELQEYYKNHGDIIISVGGGELMNETLANLDMNVIETSEPKWYMGYSDNTHFTFILSTMYDTAAIYGPHAGAFGMNPIPESVNDSFDLLMGKNLISHGYDKWEIDDITSIDNPLAAYNMTEDTVLKFFNWNGEKIEGRFIGGCMDVLNNICGTKFDKVKDFNERYRKDGIIWFLEACEYNPMRIRRGLWQLRNAGWFNNVKAFIFGRPMCIKDGNDDFGQDEYMAVLAALKGIDVPIIMDADIGHFPPSMPMISGGYGIISQYKIKNIRIDWLLK